MEGIVGALGTTGVGSLCDADEASALALAAACDVPFLPELPGLDETERMPQSSTADHPERLLRLLERLPESVSTVKVQTPGPMTASVAPSVVMERALRLHRVVVGTGRRCLVVLDEPLLTMRAPTAGLRKAIDRLRSEGVTLGLHCCGDTDWAAVMDLPLDALSFDVAVSLERAASASNWRAFTRSAALILGIVPTLPVDDAEVGARCSALVRILGHTTEAPRAVLERALLSPACGLALRTFAEQQRVFAALERAQCLLRAALMTT